MAINLRLADDPVKLLALPIEQFDGNDTSDDLPRDRKTVRDMWP
ncbi:MAG: hypothetical protein QNJ13_02235 [Paracoccaceae bacterium]|nr:hypothetical protein [Paracoccaceae bacterium]